MRVSVNMITALWPNWPTKASLFRKELFHVCFGSTTFQNLMISFHTKTVFLQDLRQDPLDLSFWSLLTFLHHGIEEVERHLLWKFHKKNSKEKLVKCATKLKLLACIRFLYKVVHKIGRLRKFNRAREIEFNFFTAWTIFMKLGTLVHHIHGNKICLRFFNFCLGT